MSMSASLLRSTIRRLMDSLYRDRGKRIPLCHLHDAFRSAHREGPHEFQNRLSLEIIIRGENTLAGISHRDIISLVSRDAYRSVRGFSWLCNAYTVKVERDDRISAKCGSCESWFQWNRFGRDSIRGASRTGVRLPSHLWRGVETVRKFIVADTRFSLDRARGGIAQSAAEVPFQLSRSHTGSALVFLRLQ
jgi:hypothetical protein